MPTATPRTRAKLRRAAATALAPEIPTEPIWRITVDQYDEMIRAGILTADDPVELLEGWLVQKMPKNDPHILAGKLLRHELELLTPAGWHVTTQDPIRLSDSQPGPDVSIVRGSPRDFGTSKPTPEFIGLVVEVSDSSLEKDRVRKKTMYARERIELYWVVNLSERMIEVFSEPTGATKRPDFRQHQTFSEKQRVPVVSQRQESRFNSSCGCVAVTDCGARGSRASDFKSVFNESCFQPCT